MARPGSGTLQYTVFKKTAKLFKSKLVKFPPTVKIFWHKDGKEDKLMCGALSFYLPNLCQRTTVLNANTPDCYITL